MSSTNETIRLHSFIPRSRANGPGVRAVIWVQGCSLACPGCFNPGTHAGGGEVVAVDALVERVLAVHQGIEGITLTGGEPLQQAGAVLQFLEKLSEASPHLSVVLFTGFGVSDLLAMPVFPQVHALVDVVLSGRYVQRERHTDRGLMGLPGKVAWFLSDRYTEDDLRRVPLSEVVVRGGQIMSTGVRPVVLQEGSHVTAS